MGFIEDKAALEFARQENNRAKAAEAAAVLNMNSGLAGLVGKSAGYQSNGLTDQEANAISQAELIKQRAFEAAAAAQYAKSKEYIGNVKGARGYESLKNYVPFDAEEAAYQARDLNEMVGQKSAAEQYLRENVDEGLAAEWMQSYKGNR